MIGRCPSAWDGNPETQCLLISDHPKEIDHLTYIEGTGEVRWNDDPIPIQGVE